MVDRTDLLRIAAELGISLDPGYRANAPRPTPSVDDDPIIDLDDAEAHGNTLDEVLSRIGLPLFSVKVICAAGGMRFPFVYPPFAQTADQVAAHLSVDRRTIQSWKARKIPMPWKPDKYYSLLQIEYWRRIQFEEPMGVPFFTLAIGRVIRGDLCALLKEGGTLDPARILAALPTDADITRALWDTREE